MHQCFLVQRTVTFGLLVQQSLTNAHSIRSLLTVDLSKRIVGNRLEP